MIIKNELSEQIKEKIFKGFSEQAIQCTGIDGLSEKPISFEIYHTGELAGVIVVQLFWEQLHIKYLFVKENMRGQGLGRQLLQHALEFGKKRQCAFAFVETMNFQALEFYKKMGFILNFSRTGYAKNTSFNYLQMPLFDKGT